MGVFAGPEIVEDGLVLALDAGNTKGYDKYENIILQSNSPDNLLSSWGKGPNTTRVGNVIAPDETLTGIGYTGDGSGGNIFVNQTVNLSANTTYTCSIWAKLISGSVPTAGTIISATYHNGTALARSTVNYNNNLTSEWKRFSTTFTNVDAQTGVSMFFIADQNNTSQIAIWGAQLERGESATDYYATTGTAKTRGSVISSGIGTLTGTLTNGVGYDNVNGGYFDFDGTNDYIDCGNPSISSGKITVNAWVKLNVSKVQHIVDSSNNSWHLAILSSNTPYFWNGTTFHTTGNKLTNGVWYMLTGVQGTTLDIYVNGILNSTISTSPNIPTNNINLGRWQNDGSRLFNGNIAQVSIYNRALTASEIQQNFNATKSRFQ